MCTPRVMIAGKIMAAVEMHSCAQPQEWSTVDFHLVPSWRTTHLSDMSDTFTSKIRLIVLLKMSFCDFSLFLYVAVHTHTHTHCLTP